jgi:predicted nucleotidyltransferase
MAGSAQRQIPADLPPLAAIVADWADSAEGLLRVFLFGSRVRGDHRPESDVDLYLDLKVDVNPTDEVVDWWTEQNQTEFAALKAALPGPLALHRDYEQIVGPMIRAAARQPAYRDRKCICVWLPPKPG